jgi:hypothetical protein
MSQAGQDVFAVVAALVARVARLQIGRQLAAGGVFFDEELDGVPGGLVDDRGAVIRDDLVAEMQYTDIQYIGNKRFCRSLGCRRDGWPG